MKSSLRRAVILGALALVFIIFMVSFVVVAYRSAQPLHNRSHNLDVVFQVRLQLLQNMESAWDTELKGAIDETELLRTKAQQERIHGPDANRAEVAYVDSLVAAARATAPEQLGDRSQAEAALLNEMNILADIVASDGIDEALRAEAATVEQAYRSGHAAFGDDKLTPRQYNKLRIDAQRVVRQTIQALSKRS